MIYSDIYIEDDPKIDDKFTRDIFKQCIAITGGCDYFYDVIDYELDITQDLVLIGVLDTFAQDKDTVNGVTVGEQKLYTLANQHPNTTFIVFHIHYDSRLFKSPKNVRFVSWTSGSAGIISYKRLTPVLKKSSIHKTGISLNRQMRNHRLFLLSYLYGLGLDKDIKLTALHLDSSCQGDLMSQIPWMFPEECDKCRDVAIQGYKKVKGTKSVIYFDTAGNFDIRLRPLYQHSLVEIITETMYDFHTGIVSEKFFNSVYGCNFPIVIGTPGTVRYLRSIGFDMFDDVVDHSYDNIVNPVSRLESAIQLNIQLLTNKEETIKKWNLCKDRFNKNVQFAKVKFIENLQNSILKEFKQALNE
jgi:hypothetical protein